MFDIRKRWSLLRGMILPHVVLTAGLASGSAQVCKAPTEQKLGEMSTYVSERYHFNPPAQTVLVDSSQANDHCFWKLHYRNASSKMEVTLYLSPDEQYLFPALYDLKVDPLAEERARTEKLMKTLVADDPPSLGSLTAPITIVEFSDFQCPYCKRMTDVLEKDLTTDERKNIRLVFRQFPLSMHPWAKEAAAIAGCAALQSDSAFWKIHDYLFDNQTTLTLDNLRNKTTSFAATGSGVDSAQLQKCMDKRLAVGGVTQDMELGTQNGVHATPTLFINGTKYDGVKDAVALRAIISDIQKSHAADTNVAAAK